VFVRYLLQIVLLLALSGCQTAGALTSWGSVPLTTFAAKDGMYFPDFVRKVFPGASMYEAEYLTVGEARSGMQMIEVKPLNAEELAHNESNLSWSADGAFLGFEVITGANRKIYVKDLVGEFSRELMVLPGGRQNFLDGVITPTAHSYNAGLRWSRDSTRYAFMSNGGTGDYNIYVGAVGARDRAVARSSAKDGYASWSPTTNEMAFVSGRTGNGDIYVIDLSSKELVRLSRSDDFDMFPEWAPDGNAVVFCSGDALNHDIMIARRAGIDGAWSEPMRITNGPQDELRPVISPDGQLIAFYGRGDSMSEGETPLWNIHVIRSDSGPKARDELAPDDLVRVDESETIVARDVVIDLNTGPAFTPDSRKLVYVKRDPEELNPIYGYDLYAGRTYVFKTGTRMNRDILMSRLGVLSFRAQVGAWDKVFVALTNQGLQLQTVAAPSAKINYLTQDTKGWL